ncbi:hypothetical protein LRS13_18015 [Svornostia abyssi]|uniref:Uncharacterized protein n=1 Tax=Svornostia abyssi TaxID=2898438 RepID=A0ABY5PD84_9ACTN|nr:hypothetical protein LRS13_18015 [Parviterribacteraceae bacterium J379]
MTGNRLTDEEREGEFGWRLLKVLASALLVLTGGLILDGLGVRAGTVAAVAALLVVFVLIWTTPVVDWFQRRSP